MSLKNVIRAAGVGVAAAALIAVSATAANAAITPTQGSTGPYFLVTTEAGIAVPAGTVNAWDADISASPTADNSQFDQMFTGPADAQTVRTFISPRGSERTPSAWIASETSSFNTATTKNVLLPNAKLPAQVNGNVQSVKTNGGDYSVGLAYLKDNGVNIASSTVYYAYITVTPGTGAWTFDTPTATTPPAQSSGSFDVNLQATTVAATDGTLNLVAPSTGTAAIGNPTLVNNLSTSTGKLGEFAVEDGRVISHPGWTLTTTVTDFKNADGSLTIDKKQLGLAPVLVGTNAAVTLADPKVAGSAVYPSLFAQASNAAPVASTKFNADLTFVAPANVPAGTYTSKLTLTLASK